MSENHHQELRLMSILAQNPPPQTADREAGHLHHMEEGSAASRDSLVESRGSEASMGMRNGECLYNYDVLPQCENACDDKNDNVCRKENIIDLNTLDIYKEGQQFDYLNAVMHEICEENVSCIEDTATNKTILCLAANYSKTGAANALQNSETTVIAQDDRMITTDQIRAKVCENNKLSPSQQEELFKVLSKYQRSLTKRPGRCTEG